MRLSADAVNLGILAGIGSAAIWAVASTLMATSSTRVDPVSVSALRGAWGAVALLIALPFVIMSGGFEAMDAAVAVAVIGSALVGHSLGDTLYVFSLNALGLTRAFTISLGLFVFLTYVLSIALLGEEITLAEVVGSLLVLAGVYLVALRGRQRGAPVAGATGGGNVTRGLILVGVTALVWAVATVWLGDAVEGQNAVAVTALRLPASALVVGFVAAALPRSSIRRWRISRFDHGVPLPRGSGGHGARQPALDLCGAGGGGGAGRRGERDLPALRGAAGRDLPEGAADPLAGSRRGSGRGGDRPHLVTPPSTG